MIELNEKSWESLYKSGEPTLVEVYSDTCVPCKMLGKVLEQIDEQEDCDFAIAKLNGEFISGISELSDISSVPTLILMENKTLHILPRVFQRQQIFDKVCEVLKGRETTDETKAI